jgi:hypothetical protein
VGFSPLGTCMRAEDSSRYGVLLSGVGRAWTRVKTCQQDGENASRICRQSSGAADRRYRRPEATDLIEIGEISTDQRPETASDIGQRRRVGTRQYHCNERSTLESVQVVGGSPLRGASKLRKRVNRLPLATPVLYLNESKEQP